MDRPAPPEGSYDNRRLLAVDDEESVLRAYSRSLRRLTSDDFPGGPFEVSYARSAEEGVSRVREAVEAGRPFAVAFVDQRFPGPLQGLSAAGQMLEFDPCLEVVMATATRLADAPDEPEARPAPGRFLVLKKPIDGEELRACSLSLSQKWALRHASNARLADLDAALAARVAELERANAELKRERRVLADTQTELLRAQKLEAVGRLAAGIAHEINTPSQFVADNMRFVTKAVSRIVEGMGAYRAAYPEPPPKLARKLRHLKLDYLLEELPRSAAQAEEGIDRVTELVKAMKRFAHPGQREKSLTDLNDCARTTALIGRSSYQHVAELELALSPEPVEVEAVTSEINQALLNLITNAAQAVAAARGDAPESKGRIRVSTEVDGAISRVVVEDDGEGLDASVAARVFEPFFTTRAVGVGSGQGLAIARNIVVDRHGGEIFAEPTEAGARFVVELPRFGSGAAAVAV